MRRYTTRLAALMVAAFTLSIYALMMPVSAAPATRAPAAKKAPAAKPAAKKPEAAKKISGTISKWDARAMKFDLKVGAVDWHLTWDKATKVTGKPAIGAKATVMYATKGKDKLAQSIDVAAAPAAKKGGATKSGAKKAGGKTRGGK